MNQNVKDHSNYYKCKVLSSQQVGKVAFSTHNTFFFFLLEWQRKTLDAVFIAMDVFTYEERIISNRLEKLLLALTTPFFSFLNGREKL